MTLKKSKAWKLFSLYVRKRDGGVCFTCGTRKNSKEMDAGHFIHRNAATFFDEWNVHAQCTRCNRFMHGNLGEYGLRLEDKIGRKAVDELRSESQKLKIWKPKELKEIENKYKELLGIKTMEKSNKECVHKRKMCSLCHLSAKSKKQYKQEKKEERKKLLTNIEL